MIHERLLSESLHAECCKVMPAGVSSPVRAFKGMSISPLLVKEGKGDQIVDVDGNSYIDFCMSWGSLLLGHSPASVVHVLQEQLKKGTSFGITTPYEKQLAEAICEVMPSLDCVRFVSSGTESTMTALRLARGVTGKSVIVKFDGHYHGHSDSLLVAAGSGVTHLPQSSSQGVPQEVVDLTISLPFNDIEATRELLRSRDDIAAIILEPIAANMGVVAADEEFIWMLREESAKKGIILIFDEVVTGFRVGLLGAQGYYGVFPDLTCLGKVIGGGLPVAALGGKREIMDHLAPLGNVYQAGTLSGNPLAMRAGSSVLDIAKKRGFYEALEKRLDAFLAPLEEEIFNRELPVCINKVGSMFTLFFGVKEVRSKGDLKGLDEERFKDFFRYAFERGVYLSPSAYEAHFLSTAHTDEHLEYAQSTLLEYLRSY